MSKLSVISNIFLKRHFSLGRNEWAVCWPRPDYGPLEVQRSDLMNGLKLAAAKPMGAQMAACTIMYQAGSRYEIDDQIGASHFLRAISSGTGCAYSSYAKMRYLHQQGAYLTCSSNRQTISYTLRCPAGLFPDLKYYLLDTASRCCYHQWELDDRKPLIKDDLVRIHPEQRALDLVQRACFAGPLSNSVFCEEERVDGMTENTLNSFMKTNYRTDVCTIASVGVPFEETLKLAETLEPRVEKPPPRCEVLSCSRGGFEFYDLGPCSETWIAVGVPGCGTCDFINLLKFSIVAAACGTGNISMGQHAMDSTPQPPLGIMSAENPYLQYKAFNISYYDTGMFGIMARASASLARDAALAAAEFLANVGDLTFKQIEVGKQRLKLSLTFNEERSELYSEDLALQRASNVQMDGAKSGMCTIDSICNDEIVCTAKTISSFTPCMAVAVVGDIGRVPHDRELLCGL